MELPKPKGRLSPPPCAWCRDYAKFRCDAEGL